MEIMVEQLVEQLLPTHAVPETITADLDSVALEEVIVLLAPQQLLQILLMRLMELLAQ